MKLGQFLLFALGSISYFTNVQGLDSSHSLEGIEDFPLAGSEFKCPFPFGAFSDPDDCSYYYVCMAGFSHRMKCKFLQAFDTLRKKCVPAFIAICGNDKSKSTASTSSVTVTKSVTASTTDGDNFVCSSFMGTFPHPNDCSKYYSCLLYRPTVKTCPKKELFDAVKKSCQSESKVHCGTRPRPPGYTTAEIPDKTTTMNPDNEQTSTETPTTITSDTPSITTETIEEVISTTNEVIPTGPPEHNCDEDDLDCIITDTGDVNKWFKCPEDVGSYAHPSSDKLFIFCMNWIPSVKKCGLDLVFSKELSTCINSV